MIHSHFRSNNFLCFPIRILLPLRPSSRPHLLRVQQLHPNCCLRSAWAHPRRPVVPPYHLPSPCNRPPLLRRVPNCLLGLEQRPPYLLLNQYFLLPLWWPLKPCWSSKLSSNNNNNRSSSNSNWTCTRTLFKCNQLFETFWAWLSWWMVPWWVVGTTITTKLRRTKATRMPVNTCNTWTVPQVNTIPHKSMDSRMAPQTLSLWPCPLPTSTQSSGPKERRWFKLNNSSRQTTAAMITSIPVTIRWICPHHRPSQARPVRPCSRATIPSQILLANPWSCRTITARTKSQTTRMGNKGFPVSWTLLLALSRVQLLIVWVEVMKVLHCFVCSGDMRTSVRWKSRRMVLQIGKSSKGIRSVASHQSSYSVHMNLPSPCPDLYHRKDMNQARPLSLSAVFALGKQGHIQWRHRCE